MQILTSLLSAISHRAKHTSSLLPSVNPEIAALACASAAVIPKSAGSANSACQPGKAAVQSSCTLSKRWESGEMSFTMSPDNSMNHIGTWRYMMGMLKCVQPQSAALFQRCYCDALSDLKSSSLSMIYVCTILELGSLSDL